MQLHELKPEEKRKKKKRRGRGKKYGMYSGRGIKGQKARAGHKLQPAIRRFIKRYPKKRGYRFKSLQEKPEVVNVGRLNRLFEEGDEVTPKTLSKKGLVSGGKEVKILGKGKLEKGLTLKDVEISKSAREKVEKAGGKVV